MSEVTSGRIPQTAPDGWRPFAGIGAVYRRQRRGKRPGREITATLAAAAALLLAAGLVQPYLFVESREYVNHGAGFLQRWLVTELIAGVLLLSGCAAILGAAAAPAVQEFQTIQAALLTRLTTFDVCIGRILAACRPVLWIIAFSCAFWVALCAVSHAAVGIGPILTGHIVLLTFSGMSGCMAHLFALRPKGRALGRGIIGGIALIAFCILALLLANPQIRRMEDPTRLIDSTLLFNPIAAVATSVHTDILRTEWLYHYTEAPEYAFTYADPWVTSAVFASIVALTLTIAAVRLRRIVS